MLDTHCHIDLYPLPQLILNECEKKGFPIISMTNLPSHFEMGYPHFQSLKKIRLALGMHPLYAQQHTKELSKFFENLSKTSYVGEIGLDFSKEGISTKDIQIDTFTKILKVVSGQKKILSIHSRQAEKEVLELLLKYKVENAIFHWYSGPLYLIEEIARAGYYFSINPAMTRSVSGRKVISQIPKELLLTETDGPFVIEHNEPVKPGQVFSVVSYLADLLQCSHKEIEQLIEMNFNNIIKKIRPH